MGEDKRWKEETITAYELVQQYQLWLHFIWDNTFLLLNSPVFFLTGFATDTIHIINHNTI